VPEQVLLQDARSHACISQRRLKITCLKPGNESIWCHLLKLKFNSDRAKLTLKRQANSLVRLIPQNKAPKLDGIIFTSHAMRLKVKTGQFLTICPVYGHTGPSALAP
jgi:hypothetical protein